MLQFGCMRYLRHAREKKQLSQDQLAELSGVPQNTISRIERGRRLKPHKSTLDKLARVLDVDQPAMLAMDLKGPTFDDLIKGTAEERLAYIGFKRVAGELPQYIANLKQIFEAAKEEAAKEDSSSYPVRWAQLESAVLLGYALRDADPAQVGLDEHSERKEEVSTEEPKRVLTESS
jgi:transcriptional regulator with XRE-family HTH domain